jgi:hypothetical protein
LQSKAQRITHEGIAPIVVAKARERHRAGTASTGLLQRAG